MGGDCAPREDYLRELRDEFVATKSFDAKCQVLANLSNFAYDPANFEYIRNVGVLKLFLEQLRLPEEENLTHFACNGICNLCLDPQNAEIIIKNDGINLLIRLLSSDHEETLLNALTSLFYLADQQNSEISVNPIIIRHVLTFRKSDNPRIKNLADIIADDVCDKQMLTLLEEQSNNKCSDNTPSDTPSSSK